MPAFSAAICATVSPRISVCSRDIEVSTASSGFCTALVASSLPPSPVSSTAYFTWFLAKITMPMAKIYSKKVGCGSPRRSMAATALSTSKEASTNSWRLQGCKPSQPSSIPPIQNLSSISTRCGDVNSAIRLPAAKSTLARNAHTLPLPLLPATWMTWNRSCGFPSSARSSLVCAKGFFCVKRGIARIFSTVCR